MASKSDHYNMCHEISEILDAISQQLGNLKFECIINSEYNNYLCTFDLYSPLRSVLDVCISITRASGRGLGPGIREFFGPCEMASSR
jgi:hypothetical protein